MNHRWQHIPQLKTQKLVWQGNLQRHLLYPTRAHGLLDYDQDKKRDSKRKWADREYHVQEIK